MSLEKLVQISSSSAPQIYCTNPTCSHPSNDLGNLVCATCHTPITYRYLWALGAEAAQIPPGQFVGNRYYATGSQIWLDTKPGILPQMPETLSDQILPYLYLYPHQLHVPEVYGIYALGAAPEMKEVVLLSNAPVDAKGSLLPSLIESWPKAPAIRQVYWLWQMLELWAPLSDMGAAYSLFVKENLWVEGWRIRLRELHQGKVQPTIRDLAEAWSALIETSQATIRTRLQEIQKLMRENPDPLEVAKPLNQLLLEQAAQKPLHLAVAGDTETGPKRLNNEDTCYPSPDELKQQNRTYPDSHLIPYLSIVCDGVGGHDGGEVAAQLAVQSIRPLVYSFIEEIAAQDELYDPELVTSQLQEIVRVANNVIAVQNDEQGRAAKSRMGTTLVMALQLPQKIKSADGTELGNSHELYVVNVGDSRAYWITRNACQQLTIDDNVAVREVCMGRALYLEALQRHDSGALTQALGTREAELLYPEVQRLVVEEDGVLLLCSDGLSDNNWVEKSWTDIIPGILSGEKTLEAAVREWIELANTKNGQDNVSVVLTCGSVSQKLVLAEVPEKVEVAIAQPEPELTEASRALMDDSSDDSSGDTAGVVVTKSRRRKPLPWPLIWLIFLSLIGIGLAIWQQNRSKTPETPQETVRKA
ncbi:MAG: PP2C family protein-serine/threonine phosphatase [Microcoleaceae cyanobacterium]